MRWIRSPIYDLAFVFGGAALSLSLPVAATAAPAALVPLFFWAWVFFFEGSHFWATYSRTYMDRRFRGEHPVVLYASLLFFVFPAAAVATGNTTVYGFFIFLWSLVHNTRQHYGFVAIYNRKANADDATLTSFRWCAYLSTVGPMLHFALAFKLGGDYPRIAEALGNHGVLALVLARYLPAALSVASVGYLAWLWWGKKGSRVAVGYLATCIVFYNAMFYLVAHQEPLFPSPIYPAQALMVVTIMNSLFHNIQYHAIVWHFSRKRYGEKEAGVFGLAQRVNSNLVTYAVAALTFSALFTLVFWWRGDLPFFGAGRSAGMADLAYVVYFGIVGHHFYLDQKIWRVSRGAELAGYFALPAASPASRVEMAAQ